MGWVRLVVKFHPFEVKTYMQQAQTEPLCTYASNLKEVTWIRHITSRTWQSMVGTKTLNLKTRGRPCLACQTIAVEAGRSHQSNPLYCPIGDNWSVYVRMPCESGIG